MSLFLIKAGILYLPSNLQLTLVHAVPPHWLGILKIESLGLGKRILIQDLQQFLRRVNFLLGFPPLQFLTKATVFLDQLLKLVGIHSSGRIANKDRGLEVFQKEKEILIVDLRQSVRQEPLKELPVESLGVEVVHLLADLGVNGVETDKGETP